MMYSAIVGSIDPPRTDMFCFTEPIFGLSPRLAARQYKILAQHWLPKEDCTVYLDGSVTTNQTEAKLLLDCLGDADLALFAHPFRHNPLEELRQVTPSEYFPTQQVDAFLSWAMPFGIERLPLYEGAILLRRQSETMRRFSELWWNLVTGWSERDQVVLPIALACFPELKVRVIGPDFRHDARFKQLAHGTKRELPVDKPAS